ncbi:MAG: hypothetical protein ACREDF_04295 [Thermoplasmata archaeon]
MKEGLVEEAIPRDGTGVVTNFVVQGPKTVPRIDYERIFVLDTAGKLLGEYVLRDDCPLEAADLERSIPLNGMRHLVTFYQGEYAFTPFRVEDLWFVVLTHGIPRIEERGSIGTLLAAMRIHLPLSLSPTYAAREENNRERASELEAREATVTRREQRVTHLEAELQIAAKKLKAWDTEIRGREARLNSLRDYAIQMQRTFRLTKSKSDSPREPVENPPGPGVTVPPPP